jgi:gliding motility-associated-like protein
MGKIKHLLVFIACINCISTFAQQSDDNRTNTGWTTHNIFHTDVFIENFGQFDNWANTPAPIIFAVNNSDKIFFTKEGITFKVEKRTVSEEKNAGKEEEEKLRIEVFYVNMQWIGANPNRTVEVSDETQNYYTFGEKGYENIKARGYRKIIYKNLYDGIDVEYTIPEKGGIKYRIIVHPAADVKRLKMKYTGDVKKLKLDSNGNILISTAAGDITDHTPVCYYENSAATIVPSAFQLNDNVVSFSFNQFQTDNSKTSYFIIDPWTTTPVSLETDSSAFDITYDDYGNVYVSGGTLPFKLSKYTSSGVCKWTFTSSYLWGNYHYSKLCVLPQSGTVFIGEGADEYGPMVMKIDNSGFMKIKSQNFSGSEEIWVMFYNHCTGQLAGFGGGTKEFNNLQLISDTNLSSSTPKNFNGNSTVRNDIASVEMDANGDFYALISSQASPYSNYIMKSLVSKNYNPPVAFNSKTFYDFYETFNYGIKGYHTNITVKANALALNTQFLFSYDGKTLEVWDKTSGTMLSSLIVNTNYSGGQYRTHEGIAVDNCNHIYLGGTKEVHVFYFNAVSKKITSLPSITSNITNEVYDIKLDQFSGNIYVCGKGFITKSSVPVCNSNSVKLNLHVDSCLGTASVFPNGGTPPYTIKWSTGATSDSIKGLSPGTYYVTVTDNSCNRSRISAVINIKAKVNIHISNDTAICRGSSVILKVTGADSYKWSPAVGLSSTNDSIITATPNTTTQYSVVASRNGCIATNKVTIKVGPDISFTGNSIICKGDSIQLNASGGITYLWESSDYLSDTGRSNPTVFPPVSTMFVVTVSDSQCTSKDSILIIVKSINPGVCCDSTICIGETIKLSASGGLGYLWSPSTYLDKVNIPNPRARPLVPTMYYIQISDLPCVATDSVYIDLIECNQLDIPNIFTPNGDSINDYFKIVYKGIKTYHLTIYNRWGNIVFTSDDKEILWDGINSDRKPVTEGVYYFILEIGLDSYSGTVTLFR